jgi:DNA-binding CsgD family transcriptional regulator
LEAKPLLGRMDDLEARLPEVYAANEALPFGLTIRQIEVLRLVARGQTDAEVAEKLFISHRTVGQHLRNAYDKLGVNNRTEATRIVVEQGII